MDFFVTLFIWLSQDFWQIRIDFFVTFNLFKAFNKVDPEKEIVDDCNQSQTACYGILPRAKPQTT